MVFIGSQAVYEGTTATADPVNQPFIYQQIQNSINGDPVDVVGKSEGVKYLLGTQGTALIANHFQYAMTVRRTPQSGCFQQT